MKKNNNLKNPLKNNIQLKKKTTIMMKMGNM